MSMRGNYSVTMDRGAVVGLGCTSDGPPTPGISSFKSWTFSVGVCSKGTFIADSYNCNGEITKHVVGAMSMNPTVCWTTTNKHHTH